ncbi:MAG: hypothetical protein ACFFEV_01415 [Candidatus Thorarchaeota archaeon]
MQPLEGKELKIPRLDPAIRKEFSSIIRYIESAPPITFRNLLAEIGVFVQQVRHALRKNMEIPHKPKILAATMDDALPIYNMALDYFDMYPNESSNVCLAFKDVGRLYSIYRLWKPGIMRIAELAEFENQAMNFATNATRKLVKDWEILSRETRGIYGRGRLGHLAMNLFAIMTVLWRRAKDCFYNAPLEHVAEPVAEVIDFNECLTETLEQLPVLTAISKPIIVTKSATNSAANIFYLNPDALSVELDIALDKFFDSELVKIALTNPNIAQILQKIELMNPKTKVRNAYRAALGSQSIIFTRTSSEYRFVSMRFPFGYP